MALIGNPIVSTDFPVDYASGNGSTTAFTLSVAPASVNSIDVQISGVSQSPQTYSVSGTTLTFSAAPPSGTNNIVVRHLGIAGSPSIPTVGWSEFASGTKLLFQQTAAPTGWTKVTANNNAALRVVSGTVTTGGSVDFTTAFTSQAVAGTVGTSGATTATGTVGSTTLSSTQMPSHQHGLTRGHMAADRYWDANAAYPAAADVQNRYLGAANYLNTGYLEITYTGGSGSHNHSLSMDSHTHSGGTFTGTAINLAVKYVDVIIATKD